jgi:hypothetical protein
LQLPKRILYIPPSRQVVFDYARAVCQRLAETKGENFTKPEVINGFAQYIQLVSKILVTHMNRSCEEGDNLAEIQD